MKPRARALGILFACGLLLPASAQLNNSTHDPHSQIEGGSDHSSMSKKPRNQGGSGLDGADNAFLKTAAQDDLAEIQLGKLAAEKAASPQVKEFGNRMAGDHAKAQQDLELLAKSKGVQLSGSPDQSDKNLQNKLSQLSGQQFDQQYMQAMVQNHKRSVDEFKKEAYDAYDLDVKKFAGKYLPVLRNHLEQAEGIKKQLSKK